MRAVHRSCRVWVSMGIGLILSGCSRDGGTVTVTVPDNATVAIARETSTVPAADREPLAAATESEGAAGGETKAPPVEAEVRSPADESVSKPNTAAKPVAAAKFVESDQVAAAPLTIPEAPLAAVAAAGVPAAQPFRFSDDVSGKLQSEKLAPSRTVPLEDFPRVAQPRVPAPSPADSLTIRSGLIPTEAPAADPRPLPFESRRIGSYLPTFDRPPLPLFSVALVPQEPEFAVIVRTRVAAELPEAVPSLTSTAAPFEIKPVVQDDPSAVSARRALLTPLAFDEPIAAAPEKLTIPDPFAYLRNVKLQSPPVDSVAPSVSYERPAPVVLPVDK